MKYYDLFFAYVPGSEQITEEAPAELLVAMGLEGWQLDPTHSHISGNNYQFRREIIPQIQKEHQQRKTLERILELLEQQDLKFAPDIPNTPNHSLTALLNEMIGQGKWKLEIHNG